MAVFLLLSGIVNSAIASNTPIPSVVDSARLKERLESERQNQQPDVPRTNLQQEDGLVSKAPPGADEIETRLGGIRIKGVSIYTKEDLRPLYIDYLNKDIKLSDIWKVAQAITNKYRAEGYFLSKAVIPQQEFETGGVIEIQVIEGSISHLIFQQSCPDHLFEDITKIKPVNARDVERFLLRLNDIPGLSVRGVLSTGEMTPDNVREIVMTVIQLEENEADYYAQINNHGSRFIGPHQALANYSNVVLPFQQTSLTASTSLWTDELQYFNLRQDRPMSYDLSMFYGASYVRSEPGFTLKPFELDSRTFELEVGIEYTPIRQRDYNLRFTGRFVYLNSRSEILDQSLVDDSIRKFNAQAYFDIADAYGGFNQFNFSYTRGLDVMEASQGGDVNLSRAQADTDFDKFEISYTRQQFFTAELIGLLRLQGQYSEEPLYSSEEFGYGGQLIGRAFDSSEIVGDKGFSTLLEMQYRNFSRFKGFVWNPYIYYDFGMILNNDDNAQIPRETASSAGFGVRFSNDQGVAGSLGVGIPLTKSIDTPLYGLSQNDPRISIQLSKQF